MHSFERDDGCSGGNYRCDFCGSKWVDHIAPKSQCPMGASIKDMLVAQSWTILSPDGHTAIAFKSFKTAVGEKAAHVYLTRGDEYNRTLQGDYRSEGRNILEPRGQLIPLKASIDDVKALVDAFLLGIEFAIAESYAMKLLRFF